MKSKEFITEAIVPEQLDVFFKNCSDYFTYNKNPLNDVMYRGDRGNIHHDSFIVNTRNVLRGRASIDTDAFVHEILNDLFEAKFNFPFRNGMMCTSERVSASDYGPMMVIVPCNGFTLCYSPQVEDLYRKLPPVINSQLEYVQFSCFDGTPKQALAEKIIKQYLIQFMNTSGYIAGTRHLQAAIRSASEIMLYPLDNSTLEYYAFSPKYWQETITPLISQRIYAS